MPLLLIKQEQRNQREFLVENNIVRLFNKETDYTIVDGWWKAHGHHSAQPENLSDYGVISFIGNKPVAALWFYPILTAKFGLMMGPISNPDTTKEERNEALNGCMKVIHMLARDLGYNTVLCLSNVKAFNKRLENFGYTEGDKDCSHYWGGL